MREMNKMETKMMRFRDTNPLECRRGYEQFIKGKHYACGGSGGTYFIELDHFWERNGETFTLTVFYREEFRLNDSAM